MTVKSTILQGIRTWLKATSASTALTDYQVIPADDKGLRPTLPYLTVRVGPIGRVGEEEAIHTENVDGDPVVNQLGLRRSIVSVNGYGEGAEEWLARAVLHLGTKAATDALDNGAGIVVVASFDPTDLSALVDTEIEARVQQDFEVFFELESDDEVFVEAETFVVYTDYNSGSLEQTLTITP